MEEDDAVYEKYEAPCSQPQPLRAVACNIFYIIMAILFSWTAENILVCQI
jgi:hypothetical protein